jgi:hypothetical protein
MAGLFVETVRARLQDRSVDDLEITIFREQPADSEITQYPSFPFARSVITVLVTGINRGTAPTLFPLPRARITRRQGSSQRGWTGVVYEAGFS